MGTVSGIVFAVACSRYCGTLLAMADKELSQSEADEAIEATIRAKEERIREGHSILEGYADLYEDDPDGAEAIRERIRSYETAIHLDRLMLRISEVRSMTPAEQYAFAGDLCDAAVANREYAREAYNWSEFGKQVGKLLVATGSIVRAEERRREEEAERALRQLTDNAIADFILDEADSENVKSFYLPPTPLDPNSGN